MVKFLMDPVKYRTWTRTMPNLGITQQEAEATVGYLNELLRWTPTASLRTPATCRRTRRRPRCTAPSNLR